MNNHLVGAVILAIVFAGGWYLLSGEQKFGQSDYSTTITAPHIFEETLRLDETNGTAHSKFVSGTCNLSTTNTASFTATTTLVGICSATGVTASDKCYAAMPNIDIAGVRTLAANGVHFTGTVMATTSNQLGIEMINNSGAATTSYRQATSSVAFWCADN